MRLLRLELEHVRGVGARALEFAADGPPSGVVVVEGRNEAGKSTLGDALDALLTYKDSSKHADVRSLKTADQDEAPVVTAELQVGRNRFVYAKRFLKRPSTTLRILEPTVQDLSGDEAHDRVEQLLDEGIDRTLWSSLRLRQGDALAQAPLGDAGGLAAILSGDDDTGIIGDRELTILEAARSEYERYRTAKTGRARGELADAQQRVEELRTRHDELDTRRAELEDDVERADRLARQLPQLQDQVAEADERVRELTAQRTRIEELARRVQERELRERTAAGEVARLTEQRDRRGQLIAQLEQLGEERAALVADQAAADQASTAAGVRFGEAQALLEDARARRNVARTRHDRARRDLEHLRAVDELDELQSRRGRVADATARVREAEATVAAIAVDDQHLEAVRAAHRDLVRAEAALDAASPELHVTAIRPVTVTSGDEEVALDADQQHRWTVRGRRTVRVGDVAEVEVRAGGGIEDADAAHRAARERLDEVLRAGDVADLAAAETANRRRNDAQRTAADAGRERATALTTSSGERTADDLAEEVERLAATLAASEERPDDAPPMPGDQAAARTALEAAEVAVREADEALTGPEAAVERAREERERQRSAAGEARVRVETATERIAAVEQELAEAREQVPDDVLAARLADAEVARTTVAAELADARDELDRAEPDTVRALAANAEAVAGDTRATLEATRREFGDTRVRIEVRGGEGLHERCLEVAGERTHAEAELAGLERRARAAELLKERLEEHHGRARDRYAAPLRDQLLEYGRMLYGPGFDVELDEHLRVVRRRHDGLWLEVEQLSVGAREQLALLGRLACATLLGDQGGLLLFDDALGNTDPERLERIGAVLRLAGDHCQIVVLTCYPDRYRHIGGATRIAL